MSLRKRWINAILTTGAVILGLFWLYKGLVSFGPGDNGYSAFRITLGILLIVGGIVVYLESIFIEIEEFREEYKRLR